MLPQTTLSMGHIKGFLVVRFQFEDFELDPSTHLLSKSGSVLKIEPRVIELLNILVLNHSRTVSRDELVKEIWAGSDVSDATINSRISYARQALGDDGRQQRLIKTVPQKGFRFAGTVMEVSGDTTNNRNNNNLVETAKRRPSWVDARTALAICAVVIVLVAVFFINPLPFLKNENASSVAIDQPSKVGSAFRLDQNVTTSNAVFSFEDDDRKWVSPLPKETFKAAIEEQQNLGRQLVDIEIEQSKGPPLYSGLFIRSDDTSAFAESSLRHQFQEQRRRHIENNLRLIDLEVSSSGSPISYSGVWTPGEGEESLTLPRNAKDFKALLPRMHRRGFELVDMEVAVSNGTLIRYFSVWRTGTQKVLFTAAIPKEEFTALKIKKEAQGYRPYDIEVVTFREKQLFAALWRPTNPSDESNSFLHRQKKVDIELLPEGAADLLGEPVLNLAQGN